MQAKLIKQKTGQLTQIYELEFAFKMLAQQQKLGKRFFLPDVLLDVGVLCCLVVKIFIPGTEIQALLDIFPPEVFAGRVRRQARLFHEHVSLLGILKRVAGCGRFHKKRPNFILILWSIHSNPALLKQYVQHDLKSE